MIYFVTAREISRVKIGFSDEPRSRFIKMRTDSPVPLCLERVCPGNPDDEKALHERFGSYRLAGEWFALDDVIEDYMDGLEAADSPDAYPSGQSEIVAFMAALNCSYSYARKMLGGDRQITIPVALRAYSVGGIKVGPLVNADDHEIAVLRKFVGEFVPVSDRPAEQAA